MQLKMDRVESFPSQRVPVEESNFHLCQHTSSLEDNYTGSSLFRFIMKS